MMKPFDYVSAVTYSKKDMMRDTDNDELAEKSYEPFLTNRALSYLIDCVINTLRPMKRFAKWVKPVQNEDLEAVMEYYSYSRVKAETALSVLTQDQIELIKEKLIKGGRDGKFR